jgi:hypothetical protein
LIGIVGAGRVNAVVVAALAAFSADKIIQEVMLDDLRRRGITVISTDASDTASLEDPPDDAERLLIRDVLTRYREQLELVAGSGGTPPVLRVAEGPEDPGLIIELVPADDEADPPNAASPPPGETTTRR